MSKGAEVLEENFRRIDKSSGKSTSSAQSSRSEASKTVDQNNIQNTSDSFNIEGSLKVYNDVIETSVSALTYFQWILMLTVCVILLILSLLVWCLFKMVSSLDRIDDRLDNIEKILRLD